MLVFADLGRLVPPPRPHWLSLLVSLAELPFGARVFRVRSAWMAQAPSATATTRIIPRILPGGARAAIAGAGLLFVTAAPSAAFTLSSPSLDQLPSTAESKRSGGAGGGVGIRTGPGAGGAGAGSPPSTASTAVRSAAVGEDRGEVCIADGSDGSYHEIELPLFCDRRGDLRAAPGGKRPLPQSLGSDGADPSARRSNRFRNALGRRHEPLLRHDSDPLRQRRAAYRPRLRAHRDRRHPALHAARRARHAVRHRNGRIRPESSADGGARRGDAAGVRRPDRRRVRGDGRHAERPRRRHRAHDAVPQRPRRAGDLGADGGERRRLSLKIFRLVFGAGRSLFRRERAESRPGRDQARANRRPRRLGGGGELVLPPVGLGRPTPRPLRSPPGFRHAGEISQRDRRLREARALGPVDQPRDPRLGNARAGRPEARHVCLGRRAHQLHHRDRLPRRRPAREILAGRRACDRQGHHPLPRHLLAGVPDVGRTARAAAGRRARISVQPRREDVEIGRQRGEPGRSRRGLRPRSGALLLPARSAVRAGRQLLARGDRQPDDRRSRQRHRQPGPAFAHHDRQELRGRACPTRSGAAPATEDLAILAPRRRARSARRGATCRVSSSTSTSAPCSRSSPRTNRYFANCRALEAREERPGADAARPLRDDRGPAHLSRSCCSRSCPAAWRSCSTCSGSRRTGARSRRSRRGEAAGRLDAPHRLEPGRGLPAPSPVFPRYVEPEAAK